MLLVFVLAFHLQLTLKHLMRRNQLIIRSLTQIITRPSNVASSRADINHIGPQVIDASGADEAHVHFHFVLE